MTWDSVKSFLSSVWEWCKRHWQLLVGALTATALFILFRRRKPDPELTDKVITASRDEINAVDRSHQIESALVDAARARRDAVAAQVEADANQASAALDSLRDDRVKELTEVHGDDPDEITRRLGALTGIRVQGGNR